MNASEDVAPVVQSILAAARDRGRYGGSGGYADGDADGDAGGDASDSVDGDASGDAGGKEAVSVDARSLPSALGRAEAAGRVPVIAEVKATSPTTEGERADDPVDLAGRMVDGGAAAVSVLTEPDHFGGTPADLRRVRAAVDVPVLRKDFLLEEAHLDVVPADVVLLIARFVEDLPGLLSAARERGFQALVEVHTVGELERALAAGADIVGVNNRDLANLTIDLDTFERVAPRAPDDVTLIAESGIATPEDATRMYRAGADGLLVGSAIMDGDVTENTRRLSRADATTDD